MLLETFEKHINTIFENNTVLLDEINSFQEKAEPRIMTNILGAKKINTKDLSNRVFDTIKIDDLIVVELEFSGTKNPDQLIKRIIFVDVESSVKISFNYYSILNKINHIFEDGTLRTIDLLKDGHMSFNIHEKDRYIFFNDQAKVYTQNAKEMEYLKKIVGNINNSYESIYEELLLTNDFNIENNDCFKNLYKTLKTFFTYANSFNKNNKKV